MARKREFDKDAVLQQAMLLFWARGYEATSIRELKQAMGISSSSMYEAFGDKRGIFLQALARFCELERAQIAQMARQAPSATVFIEGLFSSVERIAVGTPQTNGSMAFNAMVEFGTQDADVTELLLSHYLGIAEIITAVLAQAQARQHIHTQAAPEHLAHTILSALYGVVTLKGAKPDFAHSGAVGTMMVKLLNS